AFQVTAGPHTITFQGLNASGDNTAFVDAVGLNAVSSNQTPTIATPASASPNPVPGTTTSLSVLGADDGGEANLTYAWSLLSGPVPVFLNANGTNAAKNDVATFTQAGSYAFRVTITDSGGLSVTNDMTVNVQQTISSIVLSPASVTVAANGSQQFTATAKDQF